MPSLGLRIAGCVVELQGAQDDAPLKLGSAYAPFCVKELPSPPDAIYSIEKPDRPRLRGLTAPPVWANEIWRIGPSAPGGWAVEIMDVIRDRWVPVAEIVDDYSRGVIQPFAGRRADPSPHALNYPYDQVILMNHLLRRGVLILHGAGVVAAGNGYVFFGPSGIGKTTMSRLWIQAGAHLLNDDRVAVHCEKGVWRVTGTPWHGEEPKVSTRSAPLKALVRLQQSPEYTLRELPAGEGVAELISCSLLPFYSRNGVAHALERLGGLPAVVPILEFGFKPEPSATDFFLRSRPAGA